MSWASTPTPLSLTASPRAAPRPRAPRVLSAPHRCHLYLPAVLSLHVCCAQLCLETQTLDCFRESVQPRVSRPVAPESGLPHPGVWMSSVTFAEDVVSEGTRASLHRA